MTQEVLHTKIENIEHAQHLISNRQIIQIVMAVLVICGFIAGAVTWWFKGEDKKKDNNTEILNQIKDLRMDEKVHWVRDSAEKADIKNQLNRANTATEDHFKLLEEKMKHFKTSGVLVTERRVNGHIAFNKVK